MVGNPEEKLVSFFLKHKKSLYKKGQIILRSDDVPSGIYFVHRGYIKEYAISAEGKILAFILFKEKDIFPYSWSFNKIPNKYTYEAFTDCILLRAPREEFLKFIFENPDVHFMLTQSILVRMRGILQRFESVAFGSAYQKTISLFLILLERFGGKKQHRMTIQVPLSHKDIAELIGVTRETASIEIKKLEKKGIIQRTAKLYKVNKYRTLLRESALF